MERRNSTQWINQLKIAIINNDLDKLVEYSKREVPSFSSIKEAKEAFLDDGKERNLELLVSNIAKVLDANEKKLLQQSFFHEYLSA